MKSMKYSFFLLFTINKCLIKIANRLYYSFSFLKIFSLLGKGHSLWYNIELTELPEVRGGRIEKKRMKESTRRDRIEEN